MRKLWQRWARKGVAMVEEAAVADGNGIERVDEGRGQEWGLQGLRKEQWWKPGLKG